SYRMIKADWSGKSGDMLPVSLRIIGNDDIGIVANITSIISKEMNANLRNISVDSHDGMFQGMLTVAVPDQRQLNTLLKKIKTVKGVKDIQRL
ncbi:MAG: RelA/SpoT family protein, partial [Muribaculaceae bacterium]|nr:RelA/SpoT family protein [Muribaculaceae bacterium]